MSEKAVTLANIEANRRFFAEGGRLPIAERRMLLCRMEQYLRRNRDRIFAVLNGDLHKSGFEAAATELIPLLDALKFLIRKLPRLAAPKRAAVSPMNFPARGKLVPEPYGQVLICATWNYPLLLALEPAAGALAAGNRVVLKLSDKSSLTMRFLEQLLEECFPNGEIISIHGELSFEELLREQFDYIFFTGGATGGKEVLAAAARHLTPVTLELGGKSPCIVDRDADAAIAARRIVWGKFTNAGQTCVAPDYLLVHRDIKERLTVEIRRAIRNFYGDNPVDNPDYPWIVSGAHYARLCKLLEHGRLVAGGEHNPDRFCIAPTVIDSIGWNDPLMENEIFGPILPVLEFSSHEAMLRLLAKKPKPLALYFFGGTRAIRNAVVETTSSGAVCFNDVVMHFVNPGMPFGGVGASGMGAYHGKYTFDTFTHYKPVMTQTSWLDFPFRYPPFRGLKLKLVDFLTK